MKLTRETLLRLKMSAGLSNLLLWKIVKTVAEIKENINLTAEDFAKLANLTKNKVKFISSFRGITQQKLQFIQKTHNFITIDDEIYPSYLKTIYNPPVILFYQGDLSILKNDKKISFVGSRDADQIGHQSCQNLIKKLPKNLVIVSGGARGIDTTSHKMAIATKKRTICVFGSGLNKTYPPENQLLFQYMKEKELIISEYFNDELPLKFHFPQRNRIIAGLSLGTVVIAAKERSGSLITCDRALETNYKDCQA